MQLVLLVAVVAVTGGFAVLNGFHDVSNSVATAVRTRALTPSIAVVMAAVFTGFGALLSTSLALAISELWIGLPRGDTGLAILLSGLIAACLWGLYTWWRGYPSSSTHALIGGIIGSGAGSALVGGPGLLEPASHLWLQLALPLLLSPLLAFVLAYVLVYPVLWLNRHTQPSLVNRRNRMSQSVAAAAVALGHGLQDGQRSMAVILMALTAAGLVADGGGMPGWVQVFCAVLLAAGTLLGGWRITHTLGYRMVKIDPMRGSVAQGVSAVMLFAGAIGFAMPLSTTHTVSAAIVGSGANQRFSTVNVTLVLRVVGIWVLTAIVCAVLGAVFYLALHPLL